jgi:hypothetical protein
MKADCYQCKWRRDLSGNTHSRCCHPDLGAGNITKYLDAGKRFNIKANQHGVKKGWFQWPFNYDPIWLENCDEFQQIY